MPTTTSARPALRLITVPTGDIDFVAEQVRHVDEIIDRATTLRNEAAAWLSRHAEGGTMTITTTVTCDLCGGVIDDAGYWAAPVIFPYGKIGSPEGGFTERDAGTHKLYFHLSLDGLGCYDEFVRALCIALGGESRAKQTAVRKLGRRSDAKIHAAAKRELEAAH